MSENIKIQKGFSGHFMSQPKAKLLAPKLSMSRSSQNVVKHDVPQFVLDAMTKASQNNIEPAKPRYQPPPPTQQYDRPRTPRLHNPESVSKEDAIQAANQRLYYSRLKSRTPRPETQADSAHKNNSMTTNQTLCNLGSTKEANMF